MSEKNNISKPNSKDNGPRKINKSLPKTSIKVTMPKTVKPAKKDD